MQPQTQSQIQSQPSPPQSSPHTHPPPHTIPPLSNLHTSTFILLHGTSTSGPEFAETFLSFPITRSSLPQIQPLSPAPLPPSQPPTSPSTISVDRKHTTFQLSFPSIRFVFPTGSLKQTTVFAGKWTNAWFDIHDFSDRTIGENESARDIRESCIYLANLIASEIELLDEAEESRGGKVVLGGFSQGCAMGIMVLLSGMFETCGVDVTRIAAFIGFSGWLPFRAQLSAPYSDVPLPVIRQQIEDILELRQSSETKSTASLDTPIFLAHGLDDTKVLPVWGKEMWEVLVGVGKHIEWMEMEGVGHWYGEAGMRDSVEFLKKLGL